LQGYISAVHCHHGIFKLMDVTAVVLSPAIIFLLLSRPASSIGASVAVAPFIVWANYQECIKPYAGGGASMAYVVVFLFGIPASIGVGLLLLGIQQGTRGNKGAK
jgi:hypothetical protein